MSKLFQLLIAGALLAPVLIILSYLFGDTAGVWEHLAQYRLQEYVQNSLWIMVGVGGLCLFWGTMTAWLTTRYGFPLSRFLEWALVLPLAYPAYITAYMYGGILGLEGRVTQWLMRTYSLGYDDLWFLEIMSLPGAIFVMSLVLYPYVYLSAKASLKHQSESIFEVARVSGYGTFSFFFKVLIPSLRPALAVGVTLAVMEAVSDYGVVAYYGVDTFVTGIFRTWFGMGDLEAAAKLAALLMGFVLILVSLEKWQRHKVQFASSSKGFRPMCRQQLHGMKALAATCLCALPFLLGFLIPSLQLFEWFWMSYDEMIDKTYWKLVTNTFYLAFSAALVTTILGFIMVYLGHLLPGKFSNIALQGAKLGYAVPGAVVAIGILITLGHVDGFFAQWTSSLVFGGSAAALIYGYSVRFLAVSSGQLESGLGKISTSYSDVAKTMGYGSWDILKKIDLPLLKGAMGTSIIIVFVEVLKELPLTLILRPFNFETLSAYTLELTNQEMLVESSVPALSIVALGIVPVMILIFTTLRR